MKFWKDKVKKKLDSYEWWTPWFAWYPVQTEEDVWVWLEYVGRRRQSFWHEYYNVYSTDCSTRRV